MKAGAFLLIMCLSSSVFAAGGILGQAAAAATTAVTGTVAPSSSMDSGTKPAEVKSDGIAMNSPLAALSVTPLGVDPTSMDAEVKMPSTDPITGATSATGGSAAPGPDLNTLWKCKHDPAMNRALCTASIQLFCSGRCTRLNCLVPTNYVTCVDVCGEKATMMQPCVDAGKKNVGPAQIMNVAGAFDPSAPPPPDPSLAADDSAKMAPGGPGMAPGMNPMGMAPGMDPMGMAMAASPAMMGVGLAAAAAPSIVSGVSGLFRKKK